MSPEEGAKRRGKRELILEAAIRVFAERGFHAARVSDVAKEAGVADGTIYLYFKTKEEILLSIFEESMDTLREGLVARLAGVSDPLERVRIFARFHFEQVRTNPQVAEVLQVELRLSKKFIKDYRPEKLWSYLGLFRQILQEGQASGAIRATVDPFVGMWAFFGALDEIAMQWALARHKDKFNLEAAADEVAEIFIRGLAR